MMTNNAKRYIEAEDLYHLQLISDCQVSPNGEHILFCLHRVDRETEKKYANLWIVRTDGSEPWQLTYGDHVDSHPRWSPDGRAVAFLSDRNDEKQSQIYILPFSAGEARPLTQLQGEFESFAWSPDGSRLLCQFRKKDQQALEREKDKLAREKGIVARHITRVHFKEDEFGYLPSERWHIWIVDTDTGQASQITDGHFYDEQAPCWSPDGRQIAFLSNRSPDPDLDPEAIDLFILPVDDVPLPENAWRKLDTPLGYKILPTFSPDGRWLAYLGTEGRGNWWQNQNLWVVPCDRSGKARNLTGHYDIYVGNGTLGDIADRPTAHPVWSPDSQRLYFQLARHGSTTLHAISLAEGLLQPVMANEGVVGTFTIDGSGQKIAFLFGDFANPGDIWLQDLVKGNAQQLTRLNESILAGLALGGEIEEIWFDGPDGNPLQGWILKPPDFDPAGRYPSILEIHGGPWLQYGSTFMYEFYFFAAHRYVVYFCNPRGGQGYGEAHSRSIHDNWGSTDFADLMAWADFMAQQPYIDPNRMGVTGGSYGGYMTAWIIGHTDRFKAAVAQRVVSNMISMWGSSDYNWEFEQEFGGKPPWENAENFWRQSPLAHIGAAKTPTLVIHSEQDLRCDLEQGLQLFVALKYLGVEAELVLFPEEPHGLSRTGRTDRRVARLEHMLRWFDRYLKG